jgi:DNA-binding MurR/RpiR family transcriptional regulator
MMNAHEQPYERSIEGNSEEYMSRIRSNYDSLSKIQKKIANYILNNREAILNSSITLLARKIGTNPPAITRFCQMLRYNGFSELKFYMKAQLVPTAGAMCMLHKEDSISTIIQKMLKFDIDALSDTLLLMDKVQVEAAINLISRARMVHFYGEGGNSSTTLFAYQLFLQIGVPCNCFNDPGLMLMATTHLQRGDVAICISYSGSAEDVYNAMKLVRSHGSTLIAICAFPNSHMARLAHIALCYSCNIYDDLRYFHVARMCEIALIGVLQAGIVRTKLTEGDGRLATLKHAITSVRVKGGAGVR